MEVTLPATVSRKADAPKEASALTRATLLDSAELLFAEKGIDATSLREITKSAQANLSAVNYHFGSKEGLVQAVFFRRLAPLNERRLDRLTVAEKAAAGQAPPLEAILDAFIRPTVEELYCGESAKSFLRLMGRCFQEPNARLEAFLVEVFAEVVGRFNRAFLSALPAMPQDELFWRTSFMFGSLHHSLDTWSRFDGCPFSTMRGMPTAARLDGDQLIQWLTSYSAAGMRSQIARPPGSAALPLS